MYPQRVPRLSRWHEAPEGSRRNLESFDNFIGMRNTLREVAAARGDWAGIPMPLTGESLVVEPNYPNAAALMKMCGPEESSADLTYVDDPQMAGATELNRWYSVHRRSDIIVIRQADGKSTWGLKPAMHGLNFALRTLGCSEAWGYEQESKALALLGTLLEPHRFKKYLMSGMFLERSPRSGVIYLFRKLRPTVAIVAEGDRTRILCALCLHPIGYYADSWAGAMTPTDEVVAHLMLMRGDEPMFWRRANQHPAYRPEAGL